MIAPEWMWRMILISKMDQLVVVGEEGIVNGEEGVVNGEVMTMVSGLVTIGCAKQAKWRFGMLYVWPI